MFYILICKNKNFSGNTKKNIYIFPLSALYDVYSNEFIEAITIKEGLLSVYRFMTDGI